MISFVTYQSSYTGYDCAKVTKLCRMGAGHSRTHPASPQDGNCNYCRQNDVVVTPISLVLHRRSRRSVRVAYPTWDYRSTDGYYERRCITENDVSAAQWSGETWLCSVGDEMQFRSRSTYDRPAMTRPSRPEPWGTRSQKLGLAAGPGLAGGRHLRYSNPSNRSN